MVAIFPFSTGSEVLGFLHILAVIAAFGPLFVYPSMQRAGASAELAKLHVRLTLPALVLVWVFGMGLVGTSKDNFAMSDTWIVLSLAAWVALVAVSWLLIRPALSDTGDAARSKLAAGVGATHLLATVVLYLMVFKPGSDL